MDKNKFFLGILTLVAIYLAIVISVPLLKSQDSVINLQGNSNIRTISVNASSFIKIKPDTAVLSLGIETTGDTVKIASDENSKIASKIIGALKKAGILEDNIQTSNFNISQNYDSLTQKNSGYRVTNSLMVRCAIDKASATAQLTIDNGANQFNGISYEIDKIKREEAQTKLINDSLKAAMLKAEKIVAGTGVKIGKAVTINPSYGYSPYVYRMNEMTKDSISASQVPIESGLTEVTASVDVTFELIP
jgi:hypothetical protein